MELTRNNEILTQRYRKKSFFFRLTLWTTERKPEKKRNIRSFTKLRYLVYINWKKM